MVGALHSREPHDIAGKIASHSFLAGPTHVNLCVATCFFFEGAQVISQYSATYWQHTIASAYRASGGSRAPGCPPYRGVLRSQAPSCFERRALISTRLSYHAVCTLCCTAHEDIAHLVTALAISLAFRSSVAGGAEAGMIARWMATTFFGSLSLKIWGPVTAR